MSLISSLYTFLTKTKVSSSKFNSNFSTIKDAVNDNYSKITQNTTALTSVQSTVSTLATSATATTSTLATLETTVSTLATTVTSTTASLNTQISDLSSTVTSSENKRKTDYSSAVTLPKSDHTNANQSNWTTNKNTVSQEGWVLFQCWHYAQTVWKINEVEVGRSYGFYSGGGWHDSNSCMFKVSSGDKVEMVVTKNSNYTRFVFYPTK